MLSTRSLALLALFAGSSVQAALLIASPVLYTCQPASYSYTCENGPCAIYIRLSDDVATTLDSFTNIPNGNGAVSYTPNEAAGSDILAYIYDSAGNFANNAATTVFAGQTGCLTGTGAGTGAGGSGGNSSAGTTTTSTSGSPTPGAPAASSPPAATTTTTTTAAPATTTTTNAAATTTTASPAAAAATKAPAAASGASSIFVQGSLLSALVAGVVVLVA